MPRPPLPDTVKALRGTYRPDRARPELPAADNFNKTAPKWLTPEQCACWSEIVEATPDYLLAPSDRITVEIAACLLSEYRQDPPGMNAARLTRLQLTLGKLGMDPQGRAGLPVKRRLCTGFEDV